MEITRVEGDLLLLVAPAQGEHDLGRGADVLHSRGPRPDLSPQHVVEYLRSILLALKTDLINNLILSEENC